MHSELFTSDLSDIDGGKGFVMEGFFYWKVFRYHVHIVKGTQASWRNACR